MDATTETDAEVEGDYATTQPTKIRLKSKHRRQNENDAAHHSRKRRRSHSPSRHNHHRSRRRHRTPPPSRDADPADDDAYLPNARDWQNVDPDVAFRESLFDALADDEGAAFWEGVYGQPIHTYARPESVGPDGKLEQMSDEEYASYVRTKMWEKSHQHVVEERRKREERAKHQREEKEKFQREEAQSKRWQEKIEESLRRGEERKKGRRWREAWENYMNGWQELINRLVKADDGGYGANAARGMIPWPVITGKRKDVCKDDVEEFFAHAPEAIGTSTLLKGERVRWHPDKMQQRFGGTGIDGDTMKSITLVFQVVDRLWNERKA